MSSHRLSDALFSSSSRRAALLCSSLMHAMKTGRKTDVSDAQWLQRLHSQDCCVPASAKHPHDFTMKLYYVHYAASRATAWDDAASVRPVTFPILAAWPL